MLKRSTVAAMMLAASREATARNAAAQWDREMAQKRRQGQQITDQDNTAGQEEDEFVKYYDFEQAIAYWGYQWEPIEATTRDGYKLTLFHITGGPPEGFVRPELTTSSSSSSSEEP